MHICCLVTRHCGSRGHMTRSCIRPWHDMAPGGGPWAVGTISIPTDYSVVLRNSTIRSQFIQNPVHVLYVVNFRAKTGRPSWFQYDICTKLKMVYSIRLFCMAKAFTIMHIPIHFYSMYVLESITRGSVSVRFSLAGLHS